MSVDRVWQYGVGSSTVPLRGKAKLAYISGPLSHESRIVRILAVAFRPWVEMNHLYSFITEWCILYCIRVFIWFYHFGIFIWPRRLCYEF